MNPHFLKTATFIAALCVSVAASAATPLGSVERRADNDPSVVSRKEVAVTVKHTGPKTFKVKTASIPAYLQAKLAKGKVLSKKEGGK